MNKFIHPGVDLGKSFEKLKTMNILDRAKGILYDRSEEKERQYGPFDESMETTRELASTMVGHRLSLQEVYAVIIAMKLSRESYAHKEDNVLDAIVYLAQMNDHLNRLKNASTLQAQGDRAYQEAGVADR